MQDNPVQMNEEQIEQYEEQIHKELDKVTKALVSLAREILEMNARQDELITALKELKAVRAQISQAKAPTINDLVEAQLRMSEQLNKASDFSGTEAPMAERGQTDSTTHVDELPYLDDRHEVVIDETPAPSEAEALTYPASTWASANLNPSTQDQPSVVDAEAIGEDQLARYAEAYEQSGHQPH